MKRKDLKNGMEVGIVKHTSRRGLRGIAALRDGMDVATNACADWGRAIVVDVDAPTTVIRLLGATRKLAPGVLVRWQERWGSRGRPMLNRPDKDHDAYIPLSHIAGPWPEVEAAAREGLALASAKQAADDARKATDAAYSARAAAVGLVVVAHPSNHLVEVTRESLDAILARLEALPPPTSSGIRNSPGDGSGKIAT